LFAIYSMRSNIKDYGVPRLLEVMSEIAIKARVAAACCGPSFKIIHLKLFCILLLVNFLL
jgi:hypothetical protein